ncbi:MAG TPA: DUF4159 domain-containing protein, partial [Pirellulales bacterium]
MARPGVSVLLVALLLWGTRAATLRAEVTAEQVRKSIERGAAYLWREQRPDGAWPDYLQYTGGKTALCTLALLNAGVPVEDPRIQRALERLRAIPPTNTYTVAVQTMVFSIAEPKKDTLLILRNVKWLEKTQKKHGGWNYGPAGSTPVEMGEGDNSNSQFAVLALHEAQRVGVAVDAQVWRNAYKYWTRAQNADGSWGYQPNSPGTGSMTCAGLGAVAMALDILEEGDATVEGNQVSCCGQQRNRDPIERAFRWLGKNFSVRSNPARPNAFVLYYLYGLERTGRLTHQRFIGDHDWYREGAEWLVKEQDDLSGFWKGAGIGESNPHVGTCFALLFLSKGRRPVVVAKLKHLPRDDWNHHRHDLANLVAYAETKWQRDLTWQIIDVDAASTDDLMEASVLYLNGEMAPELTDDDIKNLREFVNRGGFLFADAVCSGEDFDRGFREIAERMFPEPEHKLHLLPPEHPIWSAEERIDPKYVRPLWGIEVGCRTSVIYCPENLSCYWELARPFRTKKYGGEVEGAIEAARRLGVNVLAYATNREPKFRLEGTPILAGARQDSFERARLTIANIKHNGGWNAAPMALPNLLGHLSGELGMRTGADVANLALDNEPLFEFPVIFMHGRNDFTLSDLERKRLRLYIER